jgi:hypothetical protein
MGTRKYPPSKARAKSLAGLGYLRKDSAIHEMCGEGRILRHRRLPAGQGCAPAQNLRWHYLPTTL